MTPAAPAIPAGLRQFLAAHGCTPKQSEAACAFYRLREAQGIAPTFEQIGESLGICRESAFERIDALVGKGVLGRDKFKSRGLYLRWPEGDLAADNRRFRAALQFYAGQAVGGEVARDALEGNR
jgi:hypothetical protein